YFSLRSFSLLRSMRTNCLFLAAERQIGKCSLPGRFECLQISCRPDYRQQGKQTTVNARDPSSLRFRVLDHPFHFYVADPEPTSFSSLPPLQSFEPLAENLI